MLQLLLLWNNTPTITSTMQKVFLDNSNPFYGIIKCAITPTLAALCHTHITSRMYPNTMTIPSNYSLVPVWNDNDSKKRTSLSWVIEQGMNNNNDGVKWGFGMMVKMATIAMGVVSPGRSWLILLSPVLPIEESWSGFNAELRLE